MRHSLHAHILYLENSLQDVKNRLTQANLTPEELEDLQLQLALGESALEHYLRAYELELNFAGSVPPNQPSGGDPKGDAPESEKPKPRRNGELTAFKTRLRTRRASGLSYAARASGVPQRVLAHLQRFQLPAVRDKLSIP